MENLEMPLINYEINLILIWSANCFLVAGTAANQVPIFAIPHTKLYVWAITLSTQDHTKLLEKLKSGFQIIDNWNK